MKELTKIKYWIFDLDNTLYSGDTKVFDQVDKKMSKFISEKIKVSIEEAKVIQKNYFHEYNTTLNGMIKNHNIDANEFLEFVHDVDLNFLKADKPLKREISNLKGKKFIFTNGSKAHVSNVTKRIGIEKLFDGVFDIVESDFIPKPSIEPYKKIIEKFKIEPQYSIFIEDIARNLKPAYELGMKTVWIKNDEPWAAKFSDSDFINYKTDNLAKFLKEVNELK
ncbi:pyrimidine 5'-nucleotidase [Pelagibacteraceae bacterium]|mgnify:FL=1|jgi:putative hydrolase of the HAD superfamily|nr:pyrimidine 5'-nucleotidase [Pelagibacteraceae bacterium]|tara:strand:- start:7355 stop:8020 length:666 start_codon:yes stop_codon:yes gene_type:complete